LATQLNADGLGYRSPPGKPVDVPNFLSEQCVHPSLVVLRLQALAVGLVRLTVFEDMDFQMTLELFHAVDENWPFNTLRNRDAYPLFVTVSLGNCK
jgi:hypothetical protein